MLVQERFEEAITPVKHLGGRLKREGFWALGGVVAVILVLWYIVLRMLSEPRTVMLRQRSPGKPTPTPHHQLTTLDRAPPR